MSTSPKDLFWIGAKGGLLDRKHYERMRDSVWLFMYFLRSQTALNQGGEGVVNYGHPITLERISSDLKGIKVRTIRLWLARLKLEMYIRTETHSSKGIKVWIAKGKSKTKTPRVSRHDRDESLENSRHKGVASKDLSRHEADASPYSETSQSPQAVGVVSSAKIAIPKGFISKDLFNYNNAAAAKTAAALSSLFRKTAGQKQPPRGMSDAEFDQRRRFLLMQKAELERKYRSASS